MTLRVIGAGFGRTGTLSLKTALEQLGYDRCYHMMEVFQHPDHVGLWQQAARGVMPDWDALFTGYQAAVDWPSCNYWRDQLAHVPDARVILSLRDPDSWYRSVMQTIYPSSAALRDNPTPETGPWADMVFEVIWDGVFQGRIHEPEFAKRVFLEHNEAVRQAVPAGQLLEYQPGDGWEPLCTFLECPVPETPYPHTNSTEEFLARQPAH